MGCFELGRYNNLDEVKSSFLIKMLFIRLLETGG